MLDGYTAAETCRICTFARIRKFENFPRQCLAPPRWRAATHGATRLRCSHLGTCVDPGKTRSNLSLAYPQYVDGRKSMEYGLFAGLCRLCLYPKGADLPFILFSPVSRFFLADHLASVGALSPAAGCRKRTPGSRKTAPTFLVARRYYCDICTCNAWFPFCNYSQKIETGKRKHWKWRKRVHMLQFLSTCNAKIVIHLAHVHL